MKGTRTTAASTIGAAGLLIGLLVYGPAVAQEPAPVPLQTGAQEPVVVQDSTGAAVPADWRAELESVCANTDTAQSLTREELTQLIERCDKLAEKIGAEGETVRKVYLRRLKMCRDLLAFIRESKSTGEPEAGKPGR
jgi:hypothetical protein